LFDLVTPSVTLRNDGAKAELFAQCPSKYRISVILDITLGRHFNLREARSS